MAQWPDQGCVLVMGYRQGLCQALTNLGIPWALWSEKEPRTSLSAMFIHVDRFPRSDDRIASILNGYRDYAPFTHVIAGTEASVYPAALARRILNARTSTKSVALRCHDKLHMKGYLRQHAVPMTDFIAGDDIQDAAEVVERLGTPVVIKSRHESGGRGLQFVESPAEVMHYSGRNRIMERYVAAPEASVESFINHGEILFENITQYYINKHVNIVPGQLATEQHQALLAMNRQVIRVLKIDWGMTHMEAYLDDAGLLFGEIALRPPGGYIMELISKAYGFNAWEALVHMELDRPFEFPSSSSKHTAACILHPGAGRIRDIKNWDQVSSLPSVYKARLKVKPSEHIAERQGVGEDAGYLLLSNDRQDRLMKDIDTIDTSLQFDLA